MFNRRKLVRSLYIENFKSIKKLDLPCKKVNVFIGGPNTGKSNILEAIGILSALGRTKPADLHQFVRMRSMTDLFRDKTMKNEIQIGYDGPLGESPKQFGMHISFENGTYLFTLEYAETRGNVVRNQKQHLSMRPNFSWEPSMQFRFLEKFKFYRFTEHDSFTTTRFDYLEPPSGRNLLAILLNNESLQSIVAELCASVGLELILKESEGTIELQKRIGRNVAVPFPIRFTSESLQRTIFNMSIIYSNENSVITMEEPEAHAFPFHTKSLAETIGLDKRGNQYFIATHNPYFLSSIIEKTPKKDLMVAITSFKENNTVVNELNDQQMASLLETGYDAFFNLEALLQK